MGSLANWGPFGKATGTLDQIVRSGNTGGIGTVDKNFGASDKTDPQAADILAAQQKATATANNAALIDPKPMLSGTLQQPAPSTYDANNLSDKLGG